MNYRLHEIIDTFQGEGVHAGKPAFFIRLFGCPVQCPWCDSAGTWHADHVPKDVQTVSEHELVKLAQGSKSRLVVITGGEPTIYDLAPLCEVLKGQGFHVHLETSGAFPIKGFFDWITLSPKRWKHPKRGNIPLADEFKIIVDTPEDIRFYRDMLIGLGLSEDDELLRERWSWLHPQWERRDDSEVLSAIIEAVKGAEHLRAGWQLHKLYQVDYKDARTRPPVPLGGDISRGY